MFKSYVGVLSEQGLTVLTPERDGSLSLIRRTLRSELGEVGFWAVLEETEARCVQALFVGGRPREAMLFLDRSAREMGRILPGIHFHSLH